MTADVDPLFVMDMDFLNTIKIRGLRLRASRDAVAEKVRLVVALMMCQSSL